MKVKPGTPGWDPTAYPSFWINHASRLLMRLFEQRLRPHGFGMAYFPVINALQDDGSLLQKDLATRAHVEQPTMAALIARMERDGLVERRPDPADGRASRIALTKSAKTRFPNALGSLRDVADQVTRGFSAEERRTFLALLKRATQNLDELAGAA